MKRSRSPARGLPVILPPPRGPRAVEGVAAHAQCRLGPADEPSGQLEGPMSVPIVREGLGSRSSPNVSSVRVFPRPLRLVREFSRHENRSRAICASVHVPTGIPEPPSGTVQRPGTAVSVLVISV